MLRVGGGGGGQSQSRPSALPWQHNSSAKTHEPTTRPMPEKQRSSMSPGLCSALMASDPCLDQGVTLGLDVLAADAREDSR